jgi:hypothetical protein
MHKETLDREIKTKKWNILGSTPDWHVPIIIAIKQEYDISSKIKQEEGSVKQLIECPSTIRSRVDLDALSTDPVVC